MGVNGVGGGRGVGEVDGTSWRGDDDVVVVMTIAVTLIEDKEKDVKGGRRGEWNVRREC